MKPVYVWTDLGGKPTLVGATNIDRGSGIFRYAPDYGGPAIDPINLPVSDAEYRTTANKGVFGVLADAGPDSWGRRVLAQMHPKRMSNAGPLDVLVLAQGGVGSLLFSSSRDTCKPRHPGLLRDQLGAAAEGAQTIDQGRDLRAATHALLHGSTGLGGAHPKVQIHDGHDAWIAKFRSHDDIAETPLIEWAYMRLAAECRILVADVERTAIGERHALLVRRFDRSASATLHYASAHALWNQTHFQQRDLLNWASYAGIAELRRKLPGGSVKIDAAQLFRRMVFNVLIGNTDDHGRNHGFLMDSQGEWSLAPAFDLLPTLPGGDLQALGVGPLGATRDITNISEGAALFGLDRREAREIINDTQAMITARLADLLHEAGVSAADHALCEQRRLSRT